MIHRLTVSTECPTCGAPLDFAEGSNAIHCAYCRSNLLVTGRKQVLSYYIAPKVNFHRAVTEVVSAHKAKGWWPFRLVKAQLYFIPYYRFTGHDFRWEEAPPSPKGDTIRGPQSSYTTILTTAALGKAGLLGKASKAIFRDRYVEKNFLACNLYGVGLYSLGIRPAVLRLELFRREALESMGKIVEADIGPEAALSRGMKTVKSQHPLYRRGIGRVLSVI